MKKSAIGLFFAAFLSLSALAQSVQEGINHLYAQRFQSARSAFEKMLAANPNNIEATYWLGQTYLAQNNIPAARSLYEKALMSTQNAPLIMAGLGGVELMEGKAGEARAHFEAAINASRGKKGNDPAVLNAVGKANVMAYTESSKKGDLDYAISKLTEASTLAPTNPDIFLNLGNAYRKKGNKGGEAIQAYRQATTINPAFAVAPYRAALLYKTQVTYRDPNAWAVVLENLNSAITADPKFAPAYEELYYYNLFSKQDFPAAKNLANQYVTNSDPSAENEYLKMSLELAQKNYAEATRIGKTIISSANNNARPIVYRAMTLAYLNLKDSATACEYVDQFFAKATDEDVLGSDFIMRAQACGRNNPDIIRENIFRAIGKDSGSLSRQRRTLMEAIDDAKASGQRILEAELRMMDYQLRQDAKQPTSPTELISYMALPFFFGGAYHRTDSIAQVYSKLVPDSIYGYYWSAKAKQAMDTSQTLGLYAPDYEKTLEIALLDTVRYKPMGLNAASSLAIYSYNVKKDPAKALEYANKGLKFEYNNANLLNIVQIINKAKQSRPTSPPVQKNNTSNNGAKDTKVKTTGTKTKVKKG
jgi:Flp pilus assembly protein TadD